MAFPPSHCWSFAWVMGALLGLAVLEAEEPAAGSACPVSVSPAGGNRIILDGPWRVQVTRRLPVNNGERRYDDAGVSEVARPLLARQVDDRTWAEVPVPQEWGSYGPEWKEMDGEAVFRRTVIIPPTWVGRDLELLLGPIDDFDDTFVNGQPVGHTDARTVGHWAVPRRYPVPGRLVVAGELVIAVRVFDHYGGGGFTGQEEPMQLRLVEPPGTVGAIAAPATAVSATAAPTRP